MYEKGRQHAQSAWRPCLLASSVMKNSLLVATLAWLVFVLPGGVEAATSGGLYQQRVNYKIALDHLTAGRMRSYYKMRDRLDDYVLRPYLSYLELQSRLSRATAVEVLDFRSEYADLPVADIVYYRWMKRLGKRREWQTFLDHYETSVDAELRCYQLRAFYGTGERERAFAGVPELWIVGESQAKACDPLFEVWIKADLLTEGMVWERLVLALDANETTLARYLLRFFDNPLKAWAQSYYNVHVKPGAITRTSRYQTDTEYSRAVIAHGIKRLARRDAAAASGAWLSYRSSHSFTEAELKEVTAAVLVGQANEGHFPGSNADEQPDEAALGIAEAAVANESWSDAAYWIDRLPADVRNERRWQYWLARSLASSTLASERAQLTYQKLAAERDYYGFLAAEQRGQPVNLNHQPSVVSAIQINQVRRLPAVQRATELYAIGDLVNARREWYKLLPTLNTVEKVAAAKLAANIGWTSQSVRTANDTELRNTLELRFPLAYFDSFQRVSHITTIPNSFLLAIARQESAFDPRARSSANARGLMQLMLVTATAVAKRVGLARPSTTDLYDPPINVEIAGHHLAALFARYGNRRPLAAAAYNAGRSRVDRWIADAPGKSMDVWIETIPFRETRNYVKNVLAYAQVYSHLLGSPVPMLQVHETSLP